MIAPILKDFSSTRYALPLLHSFSQNVLILNRTLIAYYAVIKN